MNHETVIWPRLIYLSVPFIYDTMCQYYFLYRLIRDTFIIFLHKTEALSILLYDSLIRSNHLYLYLDIWTENSLSNLLGQHNIFFYVKYIRYTSSHIVVRIYEYIFCITCADDISYIECDILHVFYIYLTQHCTLYTPVFTNSSHCLRAYSGDYQDKTFEATEKLLINFIHYSYLFTRLKKMLEITENSCHTNEI